MPKRPTMTEDRTRSRVHDVSFGAWCFEHKWWILGAWVIALVLLVALGTLWGGKPRNNYTIPAGESRVALDILERDFPSQGDASAQIVLRMENHTLSDPAIRAGIAETIEAVSALAHVSTVGNPYSSTASGAIVSSDDRYAIIAVGYDTETADLSRKQVRSLESTVGRHLPYGIEAAFTGDLVSAYPPVQRDYSELIGLAAAVVILLVAFGSVTGMALPILSAGFGLVTGLAAIDLLERVVEVPAAGPVVGTMIGLGAGIDYSLFLVTRHRECLACGAGVREAVAMASTTAGRSVLVAGTTVVAASIGLALIGIPIVTSLGYTVAVMVCIAVAVATTLLPALLSVLGPRIDALTVGPLARNAHKSLTAPPERTIWSRMAGTVADHPWPFLAASLAVILALTWPLMSLRLGTVDASSDPPQWTQHRAYEMVAEGFGPGLNGPVLVVVDAAVAAKGKPSTALFERIRRDLTRTRGVASVLPPQISDSGSAALYTVYPDSEPASVATTDLVNRLRDVTLPQVRSATGLDAYVGGEVAAFIDIGDRVASRLPVFAGVVMAVAFVLLMEAFRSLFLPAKAAVMAALSIGAAYGVVVAVFQWGWGLGLVGLDTPTPIVSFLPMILFAVLFGLSMDYEVFILSRIREEHEWGHTNRDAIVRGMAWTARLVSAAAAIMVCVFLAFVTNDDAVVKMFGLGLAASILVDATVIRQCMVSAAMALAGNANWWFPRWLARIVPRVDLEGPPGATATLRESPT